MELPVVQKESPWFSQGLRFTCTGCGNCCTGGAGYVWISDVEVGRLAEFLRITPKQVLSKYCRRVFGKVSLKETRSVSGNYDCVFLQEIQPPRGTRKAQTIVQAKRICSIYPVRPLQCRTWPFWPENLTDANAWNAETRKCPGMNTGTHHKQEEIEAVRDAVDWPK